MLTFKEKQFNEETILKRNPCGIVDVILMPISIQGTRDHLQHAHVCRKLCCKHSEMDESATPGNSASFTRSVTESLRKAHFKRMKIICNKN